MLLYSNAIVVLQQKPLIRVCVHFRFQDSISTTPLHLLTIIVTEIHLENVLVDVYKKSNAKVEITRTLLSRKFQINSYLLILVKNYFRFQLIFSQCNRFFLANMFSKEFRNQLLDESCFSNS